MLGLRQAWAATLGIATKATATNTEEARKEHGEKAARLGFSDAPEGSRKALFYPLKGEARFLYRSVWSYDRAATRGLRLNPGPVFMT